MTTKWWPELYDDLLAEVLLDSTGAAEIDATTRFLVDELRLEPGARVFDQCCGTGRLSIPLAKAGFDVVGVEQARRYVERARAASTTARFVAGDAFEFVPEPPCAGAFNWWTSFGYLPDDDANARMLRRAFEALAPGGRFALDYPNVANLYADFRPHDITRRGEIVLLRESRFDLEHGLLHKRWTFITPDRRVERDTTLKLYSPDRLVALFASVGLTNMRVYGGVDRAAIALDRPRCIVVGERP